MLDILHVLPLHQRNGTGAALIDWGIALADEDGLQCYVETSPAAHPLCLKKGFRHVAEMRVELGKYKEGFKDYRHVVMIRSPFGSDQPQEPPEPPHNENPFADDENSFADEDALSPIDEGEIPYTAEAKMLEIRSSSSLRSAVLRDARNSTRSSSQKSAIGSNKPQTLPSTPDIG